jgi:phosphoserine phosphatase RsbU/P
MKKTPVIICVDDEKIVLDSIKTELKNYFGTHYIIETAEDGEDALEIIREMMRQEMEIPLIISDYIMPNIKGDELLKEVHQMLPDTLKILLTGQATLEGVTNSINNANLYRYIAKPWETKDLELTVSEAVKSYHQNRQLEVQNEQLRELNFALEQKVRERTAEIQRKNQMLEEQKNELFQKNVNITASITYARRIQQALLPSKELFKKIFPDSFIFYKPKDIVSGDFYFVDVVHPTCLDEQNHETHNPVTVIAVADCTGHGVPGALMSMLGMSFLADILNGISESNQTVKAFEILEKLRHKVKNALGQTGKADEAKDGMDIALCVIDHNSRKLQYSGAFNPLYIIQDIASKPELAEIKADRMPIGIYVSENVPFANKEISFRKGDILYMFTDGYVDQFGGNPVEKYKTKNFKQLLLNICHESMSKQHELIKESFNTWKSHHEQIDDVTVIGLKL